MDIVLFHVKVPAENIYRSITFAREVEQPTTVRSRERNYCVVPRTRARLQVIRVSAAAKCPCRCGTTFVIWVISCNHAGPGG